MKKILAMLLALCMVFALCACASGTTEEAAAETEEVEEAAEETAEETESADGAFVIGVQGPLTGSAAIYGMAVLQGAQIAVDEINAEGGIQLELIYQDDEADAGEKATNAYYANLDNGMQIMVGPVTSGSGITVAAAAYQDRVFGLTPSGSSTDVIDGNDNMFQVCFTDPNQGIAAADYMKENYPDAKIAVIYRNDDAYSQGIHDTFVKQCEANGLEVVAEETFTDATSTDFNAQLTSAQAAGADMIFLPIYYTPASVILKQASDMGYAPTFFGVDGMDGILTLEGFDTSLAEGVMLLTPFSADAEDELTQNFVAAYQEAYGEIPNQFAADAYDAVYIVTAALEEAGCTPDMSAEEICDALIGVMTTISVDGLTGSGMTWSESGEVSKGPAAVVIKDGAYVTP